MEKFKLGDIVKFELNKALVPRWDFGEDHGATGKFGTGEVNEVEGDEFHIIFDCGGQRMGWNFTYSDQDKPGFPVLVPISKAIQKFKVGDNVTFEVSKAGVQPRWNMGTDNGASGVYNTGKVTEASVESFHIDYKVNNTVAGWNFSYGDSNKSGFPVLDAPSKEQLEGADALKRWLVK